MKTMWSYKKLLNEVNSFKKPTLIWADFSVPVVMFMAGAVDKNCSN